MLSEKIKHEIEAHIQKLPTRKAASLEALSLVQQHNGWVSDDDLRQLAEFLEMSPHELDSVATFYNLVFRRPVGRHVILVCDSISCWVMGYEKLVAQLEQRLGIKWGETTTDERFTLLPIPCLGTCDHAPALMIDDDLHRDLTPDGLEEILERYE